jgi:hypothetical protein
MSDPYAELSVFLNLLDELKPFEDKKTAQEFQKNNPTTNSTILIPFFENERIKLLLPGPINASSLNLNKNLRIIGARNSSKRKNILIKVKHFFYQKLGMHYVRNVNELVGDSITLEENRFIIIYNQINSNNNDESFEKFIDEQNLESTKQFNKDLFGGKPFINPAKLSENLSKLATSLKIEGGRTYFIFKQNGHTGKLLRQTFKQDNKDESAEFLKNEKACGYANSAELKPHKYKNYHLLGFVSAWIKWTFFAAVTGIGAGLIIGFFITSPLGSILAAIIAVMTFIGISGLGFSKAVQNNRTTIEFGEPELIDKPQLSFIFRVKNFLSNFLVKKSNKMIASENRDSEIFTTNLDFPVESNSPSISHPTCADLVKSSLSLSLLFKSRPEHHLSITENHHIQSTFNL